MCTTNEGNILGLRKNYKKTKTIGRQWNWNFFHIPSSPHNFFLLYSHNRRTWLKFIQWVENIYLQECIPVGCVPPARNRMGRGSPQETPWDRDPPWTETPLDRDTPWTETPPGQGYSADRDPPCRQKNTCENANKSRYLFDVFHDYSLHQS